MTAVSVPISVWGKITPKRIVFPPSRSNRQHNGREDFVFEPGRQIGKAALADLMTHLVFPAGHGDAQAPQRLDGLPRPIHFDELVMQTMLDEHRSVPAVCDIGRGID